MARPKKLSEAAAAFTAMLEKNMSVTNHFGQTASKIYRKGGQIVGLEYEDGCIGCGKKHCECEY